MAWSAIRSSTRSSKRFLFREFRFRSQEIEALGTQLSLLP